MLKISKKQLHHITIGHKEIFIHLMINYVKENFHGKAEDPELEQFVRRIIQKGEIFGYELEPDFEFFIDLHCSFQELNEEPLPEPLKNILTWPDREPEEKNEMLFNALKFNYHGTKS